jgi:predicted permease
MASCLLSFGAMQLLLKESIQSLRTLRKSKGFAATAILCLMLGIGGCTAIFTVLHSILLKPLPWKDPHKLVLLWNDSGGPNENELAVSLQEFRDYENQITSFSSLAGFEYGGANLTFPDGAKMLWVTHVSPSLFSMLGARPLFGRVFADDEFQSGSEKVVILSHSLWQQSYGGDRQIIGRKVQLNGQPHFVIGVMPREFALPTDYRWQGNSDAWLPLNMDLMQKETRRDRRLWIIGRLSDSATFHRAQSEVKNIVARLQIEYPDDYPGSGKWSARIVLAEDEVLSKIRTPLFILSAAVVFVFLISTVNVANLLLIRAEFRKTEMAIRTALGAGPMHLFRQSFLESFLLTAIGGMAGVFSAHFGLKLILSRAPVTLPRAALISVDSTVLAVTMGVVLTTSFVLAFISVVNSMRRASISHLRFSQRTIHSHPSGQRIRRILTIFQIALAFVLITGTGLFIKTLQNLMRIDTGYNIENVLTGDIALPPARYPDDASIVNFYENLQERTAAIPGVESTSITTSVPFWNPASLASLDGLEVQNVPETGKDPVTVSWEMIGNNFGRTMGVKVLEGRLAVRNDNQNGEAVAFISKSLANRFFPGSSSLGKMIRYRGSQQGEWLKIAGVVNDVRDLGVDVPSGYRVYLPYQQMIRSRGGISRYFSIVVRTSKEASSVIASLRNEIRLMDRELPIGTLQPLKAHLDSSLSRQNFTVLLLVIFGSIAFTLAAVGTYGIISYSISERRKEFGVRMAVGATPLRIASIVVAEAAAIGIIGVMFGCIAAMMLGKIISSSLYGVTPSDTFTYAICATILLFTVLLSSYMPAHRARNLEITRTLREE